MRFLPEDLSDGCLFDQDDPPRASCGYFAIVAVAASCTVRDGRIVALRDCRDRQEALHLTGIQS